MDVCVSVRELTRNYTATALTHTHTQSYSYKTYFIILVQSKYFLAENKCVYIVGLTRNYLCCLMCRFLLIFSFVFFFYEFSVYFICVFIGSTVLRGNIIFKIGASILNK